MLPLIALAALLVLTFCQPVPVPIKPQATSYRVYLPSVGAGPLSTATKKGVGLTYSICEDTYPLGVGWQYDWNSNTPSCFQVESVPMIWGRDIPAQLGGNSAWLLGFNEPDQDSQANLSSVEGAELWRIVERRFPDRRLVAPAPSDADPRWIVRFRDAYLALYYELPRLDALAVHCYQSAQACIELVRWYLDRAREWGVPEVWVTEYAFCETPADYAPFAAWMETEPGVTRYAAFAARIYGGESWWQSECNPRLIEPDGSLSEIGRDYASLGRDDADAGRQ